MVFDPYHKWLGIPSTEQPPNNYRLLGISLLETDPDVIDAAANRQMSYIHGFANSEHAALSQRILNELSEARLCLLDTLRKGEYDKTLLNNLSRVESNFDSTQSSISIPTPRQISLVKASTDELTLLMTRAKEAHIQSRWDRVIEITSQVIRNDPRRVGAYLLRAEALRKQKLGERALADLAVAIRLDPQSPHPYVVRAWIFKKQGKFDQSIAEATQAILLDPNNAPAYDIRCECRQLIGDHDGSRQDAQELFRLDPTRKLTSLSSHMQNSRKMNPEAEAQIRPMAPMRRFEDGSVFYADAQPVSRLLNLPNPVSVKLVAEPQLDVSDYPPDVTPYPLRGYRSSRRIKRSSSLAVVLLCTGTILMGLVIWIANRGASDGPPELEHALVGSGDQQSNKDVGSIATTDGNSTKIEGEESKSAKSAANRFLSEAATYLLEVEPDQAQLSVTGEGARLIQSDGLDRIEVENPDGNRTIFLKASLDGYEEIDRKLRPISGIKQTLKLSLKRCFFLSDLQEFSVQTENDWFGKHGKLGISRPAWREKEIVVGGIKSTNGISMHAKWDGCSTVSYIIDRQYSTFVSAAALHDAIQEDSRTPLIFEVRGDGQLLWQSDLIQHAGEKQSCRVNVQGVNRLELRVRCSGPSQWAQAVWIDSYLLKGSFSP